MHPPEGPQHRLRSHGVRYAYPSSAHEVLLHGLLLAIALWLAVFADIASPGMLGRFSRLPKGNDFLVFYVSGRLAATHRFDVLVDDPEFRHAQEPFLGADSPVAYPAVYPVQVAVAFGPLSLLPYGQAYLIWEVLTIGLCAAAIAMLVRDVPFVREHRAVVLIIALAFAPVPYLVLAGQLSAVALAAMAIVYRGLSRGSAVLAGAAVGVLGFKISLFVSALAVCILAGEWAMSVSALAIAAIQTFAVVPISGFDAVWKSLQNLLAAAHNPGALVMRPYLMVSWRSFWASLLPAEWATVLYGVTAGLTVIGTAWAWRRTRDPLRRVGLLSVAIVLAAPHLFLYDLVIVAPAFVSASRDVMAVRNPRLQLATLVAYVSPLSVPIAAWTHIQLVTLALAAWWVMLLECQDLPQHRAQESTATRTLQRRRSQR